MGIRPHKRLATQTAILRVELAHRSVVETETDEQTRMVFALDWLLMKGRHKMKLDPELARLSIERRIADLGISPITEEQMAECVKVLVEKAANETLTNAFFQTFQSIRN